MENMSRKLSMYKVTWFWLRFAGFDIRKYSSNHTKLETTQDDYYLKVLRNRLRCSRSFVYVFLTFNADFLSSQKPLAAI